MNFWKIQRRLFGVVSKNGGKSDELPPWPIVNRMKFREFIFGTFWGIVFLTPFVYGQYCYKTRTGISTINFNNQFLQIANKKTALSETQSQDQNIIDQNKTIANKKAQDYLATILNTDEKPGSRY